MRVYGYTILTFNDTGPYFIPSVNTSVFSSQSKLDSALWDVVLDGNQQLSLFEVEVK
jgi:hypothetical protein